MFARSFTCAVLFAFCAAAAAAMPAGITQGPEVEGVTQYQLGNGLKVVLFPDATKPTTTVNVVYLVGSRFESYGETGMAHLLEHMLFKGTPSIPSVFAELGKRGMRANANTSLDRTQFFESFAASDADLDWALRMESERMTRSTFTKAELDKEMTVVRNEFERGENDPSNVLSQRMQSVAFDWHNYGHSTIGARSDIENVPFASLRAFYTKYYQPDNAVLVVAGKFDPDATLARIAKYFGPLPKPIRVLPKQYTVEPVQDGERTVTIRRVGSVQLVSALFRAPAGSAVDGTAMAALAAIMTVEPAGRLYKSLVETHKATGVDGYFFALHDPGLVEFEAQLQLSDAVAPARDALIATLTGVKDAPITAAELDRVRAKEIKNFDETINDPQRFALRIAEYIAQGDWRLFFIDRDRWRALTPADVTRVASEYFKVANMTLGEFIPDAKPDRAPLPPPVDVAAAVDNYKGSAAVAAGEAFDPSIANLEARTQRFTLPNGMRVALLPRKTRGATVDVQMRMNYGDEKSLFGQGTLASATAAMLSRGTAKHDRQAFNDAFDAMLAKLSFAGDGQVVSVSAQTVRAHLDGLLSLTAEALATPTFPAAEFDSLQREWLSDIEQGRTDPQAIAQRALARVNNPYPRGDLRYASTIDEDIADVKALTPADMKAFHDKFYGASHAEVAIVGDFNPVAVRAQLTALFSDWTSAAPYTRVAQPMIPNKPASIMLETPDKANATMQGALAVPVNDQSQDFAALVVASRALGGSADSRMFMRVRVKDGLAYDVGIALEPASIDLNSTLDYYAIYAPQNRAHVESDFSEELARALQGGFTAAEVASSGKALIEQRTRARAQDAVLAASLTHQLWLDRTWSESAKLDAAIAAVSVDDANAALRKYVHPGEIAYVYAGDFAKK
ncbi:MAG TPA: pitrilysin family protein [Casimicrobiaceae bacterium]